MLVRPLLGDRSRAGEQLAREITDELEALDIRPGQQFIIVPCLTQDELDFRRRMGNYQSRFSGATTYAAEQLSNPDEKHLGPFAKDSETSRRAAIDAYPRQGSQRWKILKALVVSPLTRYEIMQQTGLLENSVRPRVVELIEGGWIEETDQTRPTGSKSKAVVLALTAKAREDNRLNPTIIEC